MSRLIPIQIVGDGAMYASAAKIHPRETDGRLQRLRIFAVFWLLGMFYVFPWLRWGERQMVLFDLPARKFYVFGLSFWPQDFVYLSMLLMIAAFALFFFTALAGRLWCGYACPQTVWTEVFLWIERWTEGTRNQRIKLDAAPWTRNKFLRKGAKQLLWVGLALWTGFTFVGFFTPIRELAVEVVNLQLGSWEIFWILFYGLATYGNAGYLREQVCKYMCPYARFQGAMFDRDTLIIAYDEKRGEPRGARRKGVPSSTAQSPAGATESAAASIAARSAPAIGAHLTPLSHIAKDALAPLSQGGGGGFGGTSSEDASPKPQIVQSPAGATESAAASIAARSAPAIGAHLTPLSHIAKDALAPLSQGGGGGFGGTSSEGASPKPQIVQSTQSLGDCVDCTICVQVCPTGIDIRNGLQYECIACGACADACDVVMDKVGYPRGLIRYSSLNAINDQPSRVLRPRILIYAAILLLLVTAFTWSVFNRIPLIVDVLRDRNALYRAVADGSIENSYTLKVMNKDQRAHRYFISVQSDLPLSVVSGEQSFDVAAEEVVEIPLTLRAAPDSVKGVNEIVITVQSDSAADVVYSQETRFFGPI